MNTTESIVFHPEIHKWEVRLTANNKTRVIGRYTEWKDAKKALRKAEYILGFHNPEKQNVSNYNVGTSDYSQHLIQPWQIWLEYNLNGWDADIVKRVLRTKTGQSRKMDYEKIIHICKERIRQIEEIEEWNEN